MARLTGESCFRWQIIFLFAADRILSGEQISNPLTEDIRVLFHSEYEVASQLKEILQKRLGIEIDAHEIGYVALHIHSAIEDESVSAAMQMAGSNPGMCAGSGAGKWKKDRCHVSCI